MKRLTIVFILANFCLSGIAQADWNQWERISELPIRGVDTTLERMFFIDSLRGWIVGGEWKRQTTPILLRSIDGGKNWMRQLSDSRLAYISDIYFINKEVGWLAGESRQSYGDSIGLIYKTEDGGDSWRLILEGKHIFRPRRIVFPTASAGYFFCAPIIVEDDVLSESKLYGVIGKTKDGGNTWLIDSLDGFEKKSFGDVYFVSADTGWAVGGLYDVWGRLDEQAGFVMRTVDGGMSWDELESVVDIDAAALTTVYFIDAKKGWVGGLRFTNDVEGIIAYTEDGGNTWVTDNDVIRFSVPRKIHFIDGVGGWIVTNGRRIYFKQNDDTNWVMENISGLMGLTAYFLNRDNSWVVFEDHATKKYVYKQIDNEVSVNPNIRSIRQPLPQQFSIKQQSVSKSVLRIAYVLTTDVSLSLSLYNLKGARVAHHSKRFKSAGNYEFSAKLPKGLYVLEAKTYHGTKEVKFTEKIMVR